MYKHSTILFFNELEIQAVDDKVFGYLTQWLQIRIQNNLAFVAGNVFQDKILGIFLKYTESSSQEISTVNYDAFII